MKTSSFLTKLDIANMILNQFRTNNDNFTKKIFDEIAFKYSKKDVFFLIKLANEAGFTIEYFGYNRFFVS